MTARPAGLLAGVLLFTACDASGPEPLVDFAEFTALPVLAELDATAVEPAVGTELWELRRSDFGEIQEVLVTGGSTGRDGVDSAALAAFDALSPRVGFGILCLPGDCYYFLASVRDGVVEAWTTPEAVRAFLGRIESPEEAALVALAEDFHWQDELESGAIRGRDGGWDVVVLRMISSCDPIRTDQFLLRISSDGEMAVRDSRVWERADGACI